MLNLAVFVSGGGTNLQALIDNYEANELTGAKISLVISNKENAFALERAKKHGIEACYMSKKQYTSKEAFEDSLIAVLEKHNIDLVVLAGCLMIIPQKVVTRYENRIINIHPSLIPSFCGDGYYGLKVHEEALKRGVKVTGATVHFVDDGTDTGPIILQKAVAVMDDDTPETLQLRVMQEAEWKLLPEAVRLIAAGRVEVKDHHVYIHK